MELKPEELLKKLKDKDASLNRVRVYAIHGEEDYYRKELLKLVQDMVFAYVDDEERNITEMNKDIDLRVLENTINTCPFFTQNSIVILRDEKLWNLKPGDSEEKRQKVKDLDKLLEDVPEYCTVILTSPKMDKRTRLYKHIKEKSKDDVSTSIMCECVGIRADNAETWLQNQANNYDARFDRDAIGAITEYLEVVDKAPLQLLSQEIEKLSIYAGERKLWTREDVENIFAELPESSAFTLNKAIANRNLPQLLMQLKEKEKRGEYVLPVTGLILYQLRKMLRFIEMKNARTDQQTIMKELKLVNYFYRELEKQCRAFNAAKLQKAITDISDMNREMRRGGRSWRKLEEILVTLVS